MQDFEYGIGGLDLNLEALNKNRKPHKFIVLSDENSHLFYAALEERHSNVASKFYLDINKITGGGNMRVYENKLNIGYYSSDYGGIPKEALYKFGSLLVPELHQRSLKIDELIVSPFEEEIRFYWKK